MMSDEWWMWWVKPQVLVSLKQNPLYNFNKIVIFASKLIVIVWIVIWNTGATFDLHAGVQCCEPMIGRVPLFPASSFSMSSSEVSHSCIDAKTLTDFADNRLRCGSHISFVVLKNLSTSVEHNITSNIRSPAILLKIGNSAACFAKNTSRSSKLSWIGSSYRLR